MRRKRQLARVASADPSAHSGRASPAFAAPWTEARGDVACAVAVAAAILVLFAPAAFHDFVNVDDRAYVLSNPLVLEGLTVEGFIRAWTQVVFLNWAPLTILSLQFDSTLFGVEPVGFHLTNVVLHAITVGMICLALIRMTGQRARAMAAAALFGMHPLRVESVAWIAERKDVLSMVFIAAALLAYDRYCRHPTRGRLAWVWLAMLGSLLAKATAVTLPALLLILDVWPLGRTPLAGRRGGTEPPLGPVHPAVGWRLIAAEKIPLIGLTVVFSVVTLATQAPAIAGGDQAPLFFVRIPNALAAIGGYAWDTLVPLRLHPAHAHDGLLGKAVGSVWAGGGVTAMLALAAWLCAHRCPAVTAGLTWFVVALSPILGIVAQQGFQARADRFTYLPHIGLAIAAVWGVGDLLAWWRLDRRWSAGLLAACTAGCMFLTTLQIGVWRDSWTLWSHVVAIEPDNAIAHRCLGEAWFDRGNLEKAASEFETSLAIYETSQAHVWLGITRDRQGRSAEAYDEYAVAIRLAPDDAQAHNHAGSLLARGGHIQEALAHFEQAAILAPGDEDVMHNLAQARALLRISNGPAGGLDPSAPETAEGK